jgi:hypothetical protein
MAKKHTTAPEPELKPVPMSEAEHAVKHNHNEVVAQLDAHFNGTGVKQKSALKNLDIAFENLSVAAGKVHNEQSE